MGVVGGGGGGAGGGRGGGVGMGDQGKGVRVGWECGGAGGGNRDLVELSLWGFFFFFFSQFISSIL